MANDSPKAADMTAHDHDHERGGSFESDDDRNLEALGYVPSFKREFSNLATVRLNFSIDVHGI